LDPVPDRNAPEEPRLSPALYQEQLPPSPAHWLKNRKLLQSFDQAVEKGEKKTINLNKGHEN
jgi:hypothetical protein